MINVLGTAIYLNVFSSGTCCTLDYFHLIDFNLLIIFFRLILLFCILLVLGSLWYWLWTASPSFVKENGGGFERSTFDVNPRFLQKLIFYLRCFLVN